jgi:hypothetical protein
MIKPFAQTVISACCILVVAAAFADSLENPGQGSNIDSAYNPMERPEFTLSIACMLFGLIVLIGQYMLLRRIPAVSSDDIIKNCTITIVVVSALVLIIAGYNSQQTAQAFGLFGTIVGYLLGKSSTSKRGGEDG